MNKLRLIHSFFLLFLLPACGPDIVFEKAYDIPEGDWTYENTLNFTVDINDTLAIYDLYLEITHTLDYPFETMYIRIHTAFPDGQRLTEPVSLELADEVGIWKGNCGRDQCKIRIPIQESAYFNQRGTFTFSIEQYMRRNPLPGVENVSFKLEDTGERRSN